ncbi:MAG: 3-hydroxyisobutyrate dehydrogenase [Gammaproteobacteria bacterium]|nr:3-hydroxyisobutyrate dehydrogenase [Gammaproteobacteria bacterium]MBU1555852.1 3-hydroxyisobutyrate dehydrogenase [Gammaproteobacteria bacterium]MBU2069055.1 3-hydroxyisobutyrate dehydrogenase [Gammaproteobacteria bacterium]MBU2182690.1 3-hydroxyisobutyrate dehydrogenase [Gammaproteobacteria bacterium]MBU2206716.1 3-hydroxyisobutyrate dehydrogenase [Gammaproteobacteria bacterium]
MAKVAFIGLGNMGGPMAINLLKAGHAVTAFDLSAAALAQVKAEGAAVATSAAEAVVGAEFIISMLPAGKHVLGLYLGEQGVVAQIGKDALVIDCSTIDADSARNVGAGLSAQGIAFIDAPVSGGVGGAKAGTLTFIVGGDDAHFERAKTVLGNMGKNLFHAGSVGAGQVAKICNNMLLSILMVGTSEALQMGVDNGLDPKVLSDIMLKSSGRNWTLELYNPCPDVMPNVPSSNGYQGGFMVDLMAKDLGLALEAAMHSNSSTPMGALARSLYVAHQRAGNGKLDFSSIFKLFEKKAG